jgi:RsiW-degrading membrane proteinase PrsW (M82 family)
MIYKNLPMTIKLIISIASILNLYKFISLSQVALLNQIVALFLFIIPIIVFKFIFWSDRYNLGQSSLLPWAFLLGFGLVSNLALLFNESFTLLTGEITTIALGAPIIEELLKAIFVIIFIKVGYKVPFTNIGVASVGALIGAGFAFTEDLIYIFSSQEPFNQALMRMIFAPFFHASTAMLYALSFFRYKKENYFFLALLFNIIFHIAWNVSSLILVSAFFILSLSLFVTISFIAFFAFQKDKLVDSKLKNISEMERDIINNHIYKNDSRLNELEKSLSDNLYINWVRSIVDKYEDNNSSLSEFYYQAVNEELKENCNDECGNIYLDSNLYHKIWHKNNPS